MWQQKQQGKSVMIVKRSSFKSLKEAIEEWQQYLWTRCYVRRVLVGLRRKSPKSTHWMEGYRLRTCPQWIKYRYLLTLPWHLYAWSACDQTWAEPHNNSMKLNQNRETSKPAMQITFRSPLLKQPELPLHLSRVLGRLPQCQDRLIQ